MRALVPTHFDVQLDAASLSAVDLGTLATFGLGGALLTAGSPAPPADAPAWLAHFEALKAGQALRLRRAGIRPFVALGVSPQRAPSRDLERLLELLPQTPGDARVVAIGRIGLGDGSRRAEQLLARQLQLAQSLELPVVLELSGADRARQTRRALALVKESALSPERVLVVGAELDELSLVVGCGHVAGLMGRTAEVQRLVAAVERHGPGQLVLGSAAHGGPSDLLGLSRTVAALEAAGLSPKVVRRVAQENALALLRIDPAALEPR